MGKTTMMVKSVNKAVDRVDSRVLRSDFPVLKQKVHSKRLVYLDNAATSQKPVQVLKTMEEYYDEYNSNVHRGVHALSARATERYEESRAKVASFINASTPREVIFTRNASEAINLVAYTWALNNLKEGDNIILSVAEHHSNIVPWQLVAKKTGAVLRYVTLNEDQELDLNQFESMIGPKTKLVTVGHVSNVLGCVNPIETIVALAQKYNAKVMLDACQSVPHMPVDVQALNVDFAVCSGHKMCAPTGIGFLWAKYALLEEMPPWMGGGEMIADVFLDYSTYAKPPGKFEAGTPAICEAIGLGAACDYLAEIGMAQIQEFEEDLGTYLYDGLSKIEGISIYGPNPHKTPRAALAAFNVEGLHATDVSMVLDQYGIAVRSGHHCTQPLHHFFGINASARASLYIYNTKEEIDLFLSKLNDTIAFFRGT